MRGNSALERSVKEGQLFVFILARERGVQLVLRTLKSSKGAKIYARGSATIYHRRKRTTEVEGLFAHFGAEKKLFGTHVYASSAVRVVRGRWVGEGSKCSNRDNPINQRKSKREIEGGSQKKGVSGRKGRGKRLLFILLRKAKGRTYFADPRRGKKKALEGKKERKGPRKYHDYHTDYTLLKKRSAKLFS